MELLKYFVLVVFSILLCISCEKPDEKSYVTNNYIGTGSAFTIGQIHEGGMIFYIDATGSHGLICSTFDIADTVRWYPTASPIHPNTGALIGTGQSNTNILVNLYGSGRYGAYMCDTLTLNGYNDWYLPSIDEFNAIGANLICNGMGNFGSPLSYLTSTKGTYGAPTTNYNFIIQTFSGNSAACYEIDIYTLTCRVRPIRNF